MILTRTALLTTSSFLLTTLACIVLAAFVFRLLIKGMYEWMVCMYEYEWVYNGWWAPKGLLTVEQLHLTTYCMASLRVLCKRLSIHSCDTTSLQHTMTWSQTSGNSKKMSLHLVFCGWHVKPSSVGSLSNLHSKAARKKIQMCPTCTSIETWTRLVNSRLDARRKTCSGWSYCITLLRTTEHCAGWCLLSTHAITDGRGDIAIFFIWGCWTW